MCGFFTLCTELLQILFLGAGDNFVTFVVPVNANWLVQVPLSYSQPRYNDIGLCDTSPTPSHILRYQLIPHS